MKLIFCNDYTYCNDCTYYRFRHDKRDQISLIKRVCTNKENKLVENNYLKPTFYYGLPEIINWDNNCKHWKKRGWIRI